jgi:hypothetical protein
MSHLVELEFLSAECLLCDGCKLPKFRRYVFIYKLTNSISLLFVTSEALEKLPSLVVERHSLKMLHSVNPENGYYASTKG